jgi:hypothetical protein
MTGQNIDYANASGTSSIQTASAAWDGFTPKVTLDYETDPTLLYATFSTGYKYGGFNTAIAPSSNQWARKS